MPPDGSGFCTIVPDLHAPTGRDVVLGCIPEHEMLQSTVPMPPGKHGLSRVYVFKGHNKQAVFRASLSHL